MFLPGVGFLMTFWMVSIRPEEAKFKTSSALLKISLSIAQPSLFLAEAILWSFLKEVDVLADVLGCYDML